MSFAKHRHLSVPDPRAVISSLELGSSQEEAPVTPSILVLSPQQATGSDDGYFQSADNRRRRSAKSMKTDRRKDTKLSGLSNKISELGLLVLLTFLQDTLFSRAMNTFSILDL